MQQALKIQTSAARPVACRRAATIVRASAQVPPAVSRRQAGAAALAAAALLAGPASPALAFLGFGDDGSAKYTDDTGAIITGMAAALAMPVDAPGREEALRAVRALTIDWVSRYRRDPKFSGRPSFSNLYSAINALDGQLNSFGFTSKIPAKRLDRMVKEVADAGRQLERGR